MQETLAVWQAVVITIAAGILVVAAGLALTVTIRTMETRYPDMADINKSLMLNLVWFVGFCAVLTGAYIIIVAVGAPSLVWGYWK